jgi:hypothetical protein
MLTAANNDRLYASPAGRVSHQALLDDPIMQRAIEALEARGFPVRDATPEQTIENVRLALEVLTESELEAPLSSA